VSATSNGRWGFVEMLANNDAVRRLVILIALGLIWELYARWIDNPLILQLSAPPLRRLFPT